MLSVTIQIDIDFVLLQPFVVALSGNVLEYMLSLAYVVSFPC